MADLLKRVAAVEAARARFQDALFAWGLADCVQMAAFHLAALDKPALDLKPYTSRFGALRRLREAGFSSLVEAVEARAAPIAPAAALVGDLVGFEGPGDGPLDYCALALCAGPHAFGFAAPDASAGRFTALPMHGAILAWRV